VEWPNFTITCKEADMKVARHAVGTDLQKQKFDNCGPGTVLRDFNTLLDFIGNEGIRATGKYHAIPLDRLKELDERMTRPLRPSSKRPQLRSFPVLQGLFLLLRASGLGIGQGRGRASGRLCLNQDVLESWRMLNPTEQYFSLLETWLLNGSFDIIGERGLCIDSAQKLWERMRYGNRPSARETNAGVLKYYGRESECTLALLELFGLATFERPPESDSHRMVAFEWTVFGEQLMELVFANMSESWPLETSMSAEFGVLQPELQKHFPNWQRLLKVPEQAIAAGVFEFKVSLGRVWRRIAIPAANSLEELAQTILAAFEFDDDHLYEFRLRSRQGREFTVTHPYIDESDYATDEFAIGMLPLDEGDTMEYLFDFGESWLFHIMLERIDLTDRKLRKAKIVASRGKPPEQYESYEDE
jgi:hypothetical protein